jgi:hypothetical protein
MPSPADELRAAAAALRLLAGAVLTDGETDLLVSVAALLEQTAYRHAPVTDRHRGALSGQRCRECFSGGWPCADVDAALAVARAIPGGAT